jgi:hypothetical protein
MLIPWGGTALLAFIALGTSSDLVPLPSPVENYMDYNRQNQLEEDLPHIKDYQLHRIDLRLRSNDPGILDVIHQVLYPFHLSPSEQFQPRIDFGLRVVDSPSIPPADLPSRLKLVSFDENQKYYYGEGGWLYTVSADKFMVACNLRSLRATGIISSDYTNSPWLIFNQVFYPVLAEMLKQLHIFNIHTAAVARDGVGILFPARARSGKSTIAISMLRAGFSFLSDDICFIQKNSSQLTLLGFPEPIRVWDETIRLFPELSFLHEQQHCIRLKRDLCVEEIFPDSIRSQAVPKFLILPQIVDHSRSRLQPVSKTNALVGLIPQSLMVANKGIVNHHLEILTQLVEECQCFRLLAGRDILDIPRLISDIL